MKTKIHSIDGGVPSEIEYMDDDGNTIGFWCYGTFDPQYPYQGDDVKDDKKEKLEGDGWSIGDTEQFLGEITKRDEIVASLCDHLDQKEYMSRCRLARAEIILAGDFAAFVEDGPTDGTTAIDVPNELLINMWVERHGGKQGWESFCCRSVRRWVKFIKATNFSESDKYFLGGTLFKALDTYP